MTAFEVALLGTIQGFTEFLPVSSSGHLVIARLLLGFSDAAGGSLDAFLHLGTLLAVLIYFRPVWRSLWRSLVTAGEAEREQRALAGKLAMATVPAAVAGYLLQDAANGVLRHPPVVIAGLLVTALALLGADLLARRNAAELGDATTLAFRVSWLDAVLIGSAQAVALVPGISRSGMTIAAGRARGLSRHGAAVFSFLLSAPIIAGAGLASLPLLARGTVHPGLLLLGLIVSFVAGLVAIRLLLRLITWVAFWPFAVYLFCLAGLVWYVQ
jgi:undecaprenyl-diphosphatase